MVSMACGRGTMPKKQTHHPLPPRCKRMSRPARVQSARHWLPTYKGKNIVRGYRKRYGVDWLCAVYELQMLGVELDPAYVAHLQTTMVQQRLERQHRKQQRKAERLQEMTVESDEAYAYIIGYTSGGVSYGVTWEEWEALEDAGDVLEEKLSDDDRQAPF